MRAIWLVLFFMAITVVIFFIIWNRIEDPIMVHPIASRETFDFQPTDHNRVFSLNLSDDAKVTTQGPLHKHDIKQGNHLFYLSANEAYSITVNHTNRGLLYRAK